MYLPCRQYGAHVLDRMHYLPDHIIATGSITDGSPNSTPLAINDRFWHIHRLPKDLAYNPVSVEYAHAGSVSANAAAQIG